jgi:tetratricopeptide (TPR) repeat protein
VLHNLANIYAGEGRYEESAKVHLEAITIWQDALGKEHPASAYWLLDYASVLKKLHRKKEAAEIEARAQEAIAMAEQASGENQRVDIRELQRHPN